VVDTASIGLNNVRHDAEADYEQLAVREDAGDRKDEGEELLFADVLHVNEFLRRSRQRRSSLAMRPF